MIVFDAVESYPKSAVGYLMGKEPNQVTRLINVAITRGKGKVITVAHVRFWENIFKGTNHIFYKLLRHIKNEKHQIIDNYDTLKVKNLKQLDEERQINIYYCNDCHKYWVNYEAVRKWVKMGFIPKMKLQIVDELWGDMKPISKLMLYGYDVKANHLSEDERHNFTCISH